MGTLEKYDLNEMMIQKRKKKDAWLDTMKILLNSSPLW